MTVDPESSYTQPEPAAFPGPGELEHEELREWESRHARWLLEHSELGTPEAMTARSEVTWERAAALVDALDDDNDEDGFTLSRQISDGVLVEVIATWTAALGLEAARKAATTAETHRVWKVRVTDSDLVGKVLGAGSQGPLFLTVAETLLQDQIAVTVNLPLRRAPVSGITLVAVIDYGDGVNARIPLLRVDLGEAAALSGLTELSGRALLSTKVEAAHPRLTLNVLGIS